MTKLHRAHLNRSSGAAMTDHIIIVCLIAIACLLALRVFGDQVKSLWEVASDLLAAKSQDTVVQPLDPNDLGTPPSDGTAPSAEELAKLLGATEWSSMVLDGKTYYYFRLPETADLKLGDTGTSNVYGIACYDPETGNFVTLGDTETLPDDVRTWLYNNTFIGDENRLLGTYVQGLADDLSSSADTLILSRINQTLLGAGDIVTWAARIGRGLEKVLTQDWLGLTGEITTQLANGMSTIAGIEEDMLNMQIQSIPPSQFPEWLKTSEGQAFVQKLRDMKQACEDTAKTAETFYSIVGYAKDVEEIRQAYQDSIDTAKYFDNVLKEIEAGSQLGMDGETADFLTADWWRTFDEQVKQSKSLFGSELGKTLIDKGRDLLLDKAVDAMLDPDVCMTMTHYFRIAVDKANETKARCDSLVADLKTYGYDTSLTSKYRLEELRSTLSSQVQALWSVREGSEAWRSSFGGGISNWLNGGDQNFDTYIDIIDYQLDYYTQQLYKVDGALQSGSWLPSQYFVKSLGQEDFSGYGN